MERAVETLVALAGLYLFLSVISLAVVEWFSSARHMRARHLQKGFEALLEGKAPAVLNHPLITSLARASGRNLPSYVPREIFTDAVMDVAASAARVAALPGVQETALEKIKQLSGGDPVAFKRRLETWFDAGMERLSGQYKRSINTVTRIAVALLVVGLNADSLELGKQMWSDPSARAGALEYSPKLLDLCKTDAEGNLVCPSVSESGDEVGAAYPLGWSWPQVRALDNAASILAKLLGLFATFLAASLGAPFWFDVLRRMAPGLRQSGPKPDEKPRSPVTGPDAPAAESA
jgi:hypothetical protein